MALLPSRVGFSDHPASGLRCNHHDPRVLGSERVVLSRSSSLLRPDLPVSSTPAAFPGSLVIPRVFARQPGLGCWRDLPCFGSLLLLCVPSPLRREEERGTPVSPRSLRPSSTEHGVGSSISPTPAPVRTLLTTLQCSLYATARKVACPPGLVRPRAISGRRGRLHPSLPEAGHPGPESGITTQPSWGRTVTGLPPAGVLPLQAARSVAKFTDYTIY